MATSTTRLCDACGLPPRLAADGETRISLKRCSRCHQRFYHDSACQRRDFDSHKCECRRIHKKRTNTQSSIYRVETRPNKGRCLVANRAISAGQSVDSFPPLVPPVLLESQRSSRCALCFATLASTIFQFDESAHVQQYPVLFCSTTCRQQGRHSHFHQEEELVASLCRCSPRVQILSSAILLYRILFNIAQQEATAAKQEQQDDCRLRNKVESLLQSHNDTHVTTADEEHHTRAVLFLTQMFMDLQREKVETQTMLQSFSITYMKQVLSRIKTNGFSISNGESVAIGVGLFSQATNMNHSCRPNALQTFWYGTCGKFPLLQVTACTTIQASDEICISYIDNSCPRPLRQKRLVSYHFHCTCQACSDKDYNDALVGIKCNDCHGIVRQQTEESRDSCLCKCDACGTTDFTDAMDFITETQKGMEHLTLQEQERLFTRAKAIFKRESWYVSECGELLAQSLLDAIDSAADDRETQRFCARALAIFDELLLVNQSGTPWNILKRQILLCKRAKLRLYLFPDPSMAIGELQSVLDTLLIYYPEEHEFVQEIRNTMSQAFS